MTCLEGPDRSVMRKQVRDLIALDNLVPLDLHENFFPFNTYGINCNSFLRVFSRSGRGIEGPGVPGTNQFAAFDHSFGQRASAVGTFVVQGANHPVDVGNTERPARRR